MIGTLMAANPDFAGDVVVISCDGYAPLSAANRSRLRAQCSQVRFVEAERDRYLPIFAFAEAALLTPRRLHAAFYILEIFHLDYDRVVALDSDMLVLGDLSYLFSIDAHFAVVRAQGADGRLLPYFNTGTMVVHRELGGSAVFEAMVAGLVDASVDRRQGKADQALLNLYFRGRPRHYLDSRYNFSKRLVPKELEDIAAFLTQRDVRLLHFVGEKPWNLKIRDAERHFRAAEALWLRRWIDYADKELMIDLVTAILNQEQAAAGALRRMLVERGTTAHSVEPILSEILTGVTYQCGLGNAGNDPL